MNILKIFCALFLALNEFAAARHSHPVPTFFQKRHKNGTAVDRSHGTYDADIKGKLRINKEPNIQDSLKIRIKIWPETVKNGDQITLLWSGIDDPKPDDVFTFYCPYYDDVNHYLDHILMKDIKDYHKGYGHHELVVYNMRESCDFKFFRKSGKYYNLTATSNLLNFAEGGPEAPTQGRIAMTNNPTEMRVMWTSGQLTQPPFVRYGLTKNLGTTETAHITHTYTKESMCHHPANAEGFWPPGFTYDVLLKNLKPNTLYHYAYGTEGYMSGTFNFTTPLPAGDETPFNYIVFGDMGVDLFPQAYATAAHVRKDIEESNIKFVFHIGDISYARGYAYIWEQWHWLSEPYATLAPYMVGIGNHEYDYGSGGIGHDPSKIGTDHGWKPKWFNGHIDSGGECSVPMFHRYHMPDNGNSLYWYSYDYGMVHMVMMSTEHDYSPGSDQYKWLENDLRNVNRVITPWVFIGGHRPMYCSQMIHGDYIVAGNMQRLFEELLYRYKVDVAFWAHYHSYERTCKVYKEQCVDDGVVHIVVGTAGKHKDQQGYYPKKWSLFRKSEYGYSRVHVANSSALKFEWITNKHKEVEDQVWLYRK